MKSSIHNTTLETIQWFIFLLASAVALPIVIGSIFHMSFNDIALLMQRTFFIVGVASFLQGLFGHRLPVMEGPAGIWVSIFAVLAQTAVHQGKSLASTLQIIETAILLAGLFLIIIGVTKLSQRILSLFTPLVTGSFLFLLAIQLSGTFLEGMLGIQGKSQTLDVFSTIIAFLVFFLVLGLSIFSSGWLKSYAVLIGIGVGWILSLFGDWGSHANKKVEAATFHFPDVFAWGRPVWDIGVIPIALFTAIILLSNLVASISAASNSIYGDQSFENQQMNRGTMMMGFNHSLAGIFSTIAMVPLATSAGFIDITGQKKKQPFMYAALLLTSIAFFPPIVRYISMIPSPVANAAILATFVQLMGLGLKNVASQPLDQRRLTIIGVAYLIGIGIMFLPADVFNNTPTIVQNLLSNGLLVGTILMILLEQVWKDKEGQV